VPQSAIACAIIAGGGATRFQGREKSLLPVGGVAIVDRQLAVLGGLFARIIVISPRPESFANRAVEVIPDRTRGAGPLSGIDAALAALSLQELGIFCVAGDLPFLEAGVIEEALKEAHVRFRDGTAQAVAFRKDGFPEPLSACYARTAMETVVSRLGAGQLKAADLLDALATSWIPEKTLQRLDPDGRHFRNINTAEEWKAADTSG
jgi:molybdopterin-guanine dinucleotide biosynthesis protein A